MSYTERNGSDLRRQIGCVVLGLVGSALVIMMLFGAAMGHCAPEADGSGCENEGITKLLMFPGSLIILILVGIIAARHVTKDRD